MNDDLDTKVTGAILWATGAGIEAEIKIIRGATRTQHPPRTTDIPQDILDALRTWLDGAR